MTLQFTTIFVRYFQININYCSFVLYIFIELCYYHRLIVIIYQHITLNTSSHQAKINLILSVINKYDFY
jgi:hypothetical protein